MTQQEAINSLIAAWRQRDNEFCCSEKERQQSEAELQECLRVLNLEEKCDKVKREN